ncbi:hypothetical protein OHR68_39205 [Spirillospora sp. NBC_00431]
MNDHHRAGNLDRRAAERLLDGAYDHALLHALFAAATAPARPEELGGEDEAVAAFMAAPRPAPASRTAALRRFLTIKAVAIVGGSLILTGGAAYATITGQLPGQDRAPSHGPSLREHKGTRGDEAPASQSSTPAPRNSGGPSSTSPSPGTPKKQGRSGAPGQQQKKTKDPRPRPSRHTPTPPQGPGNNNGTEPPRSGTESGSTMSGGGKTGNQAPPTTGSGSGSGQRD